MSGFEILGGLAIIGFGVILLVRSSVFRTLAAVATLVGLYLWVQATFPDVLPNTFLGGAGFGGLVIVALVAIGWVLGSVFKRRTP